ncbi:MAG: hypothetical protein PWP65_1339 [Clostridia bacterium]|nr:hypothetical protein [Clostridia bacterium]
MLKFGTDGWRAVIAEEFTFPNVRLVTQGIAAYLQERGLKGKVVIGYDHRFMAENFAQAVAEVLAGNGFEVLFPDRSLPTPVTAFAVKHYGAIGGIMLTASHNPPEYSGLKFIPEYAGPALPAITDAIEEAIEKIAAGGPIKRVDFAAAQRQGLVHSIDPRGAYLEHLASLVKTDALRRAKLKVIVDPLYGAGIDYLEEFLARAGCQVEVIHGHRDPLFGGSLPDPSATGLSDLSREVVRRGADLGLALDGDGDRFGLIDADGTYITANQFLPMLLAHLLETRGWRGPVARTVATTHLLDRVAAEYKLAVKETPVGFKYIGQALLEGAVLGGEESGGVSIYGHLPEKDGILATALAAELRVTTGKPLQAVWRRLGSRYGQLVSRRFDLHVDAQAKRRVLDCLKGYAPGELDGRKVSGRLTLDGVKILLDDGSWVLVRPSGTEPLFRLYVEAPDERSLQALAAAVRDDLKI